MRNHRYSQRFIAAMLFPAWSFLAATLPTPVLAWAFPSAAAASPHSIQPPAGPSVDLRPRWQKGQTGTYELLNVSNTKPSPAKSATPAGKKPKPGSSGPKSPDGNPDGDLDPLSAAVPESSVEQRFVFDLAVQEVLPESSGGGAVVTLTFKSVRMVMDSAGERMEYDSDADTKKPSRGTKPTSTKPAEKNQPPKNTDPGDFLDNPLAAVLSGVVGTTMTLTLDADGNIVKSEGGASLLGGLGALGAGLPGNSTAGGSLIDVLSVRKPAKGLARVGDTWETDSAVNTDPLGAIDIRTVYKLESHNAGKARVRFEGNLAGSSGSGAGAAGGISASGASGFYVWDTKLGWLDSMECSHHTDFGLHAAGAASGQSGRTRAETKTTVKRLK